VPQPLPPFDDRAEAIAITDFVDLDQVGPGPTFGQQLAAMSKL
jgi:hypothetical protein